MKNQLKPTDTLCEKDMINVFLRITDLTDIVYMVTTRVEMFPPAPQQITKDQKGARVKTVLGQYSNHFTLRLAEQ